MENNSNEVVEKMSKFAKIMGIISVCTLGIVPAFGMMALAVPIVFKKKNIRLDENQSKMCKLATILGIVSLVLFVIEFVLALIFV